MLNTMKWNVKYAYERSSELITYIYNQCLCQADKNGQNLTQKSKNKTKIKRKLTRERRKNKKKCITKNPGMNHPVKIIICQAAKHVCLVRVVRFILL